MSLDSTPALRRVIRKSAVASLANLLVMAGLCVRDVYVAAVFGRSPALDAYLLALMIPLLAVQMLGSGIQSSIVPAYTELLAARDAVRRRHFGESLTLAMLLGSSIAAALSWAAGVPGLAWLGRAEGHVTSELPAELLVVLLPLIILDGVATLWAALLQAEDRIVGPIVSRIAVPAGAIAMTAIFSPAMGIRALAWGMVFGYAAQLVWRGVSLVRSGGSVIPRAHALSQDLRAAGRQYLPVMLGGMIGALMNTVDNSMAVFANQPGAVSALNYGSRVVAVLTTAGTVAVSAAVLPYLSRLTVRRSFQQMRRAIRLFVGLILVIGMPATGLVVFFSDDLVRLLFERGEFSARDTLLVADVQRMYALQIPLFVAGVFLARVISSLGRNDLLLYISMGSVLLNAILDYILMGIWGVPGIALATSIVYLTSTLCAAVAVSLLLRQRLSVGDADSAHPAGERMDR
jgi:putative peptidoglycan lipid II flippase